MLLLLRTGVRRERDHRFKEEITFQITAAAAAAALVSLFIEHNIQMRPQGMQQQQQPKKEKGEEFMAGLIFAERNKRKWRWRKRKGKKKMWGDLVQEKIHLRRAVFAY